ncbi:hypothetical protein KDL01_27405 [Actinospica durhamensis]|uniref:Ricin B lectin domain-containing protein n=1 Tax=Actinospica durhamensis TaxID=1508375 RepID=A0A941EZG8_9ACTN|nr:RICIN domain-containing protein [Actinospica durhamensis]MBR7837034.1 hypothetical protein [Actinospica durhamensis]
MFTIKRFAAAAVAALALTGAAATTASAAASATPSATPDQTLSFYNRGAQGVLDAYCSGPQGPVTWPIAGGDACQQWKVDQGSQGLLLESIAKPGQCIQAPENIGQLATLTPCNAYDPSQQWDFPRIGNDVFIAQAGENSQVLGSLGNYAQIELEQADGAANQRWNPAPPA